MARSLEQLEPQPRQKTPVEIAFAAKVRMVIGLPDDLPIYPVLDSAEGALVKYSIYTPTLDPDKHAEFYGSRGGTRIRSGITGKDEVKFNYVGIFPSKSITVYDQVVPISTRSRSLTVGRSSAFRPLRKFVPLM